MPENTSSASQTPAPKSKLGRIIFFVVMLTILGLGCFMFLTETGSNLIAQIINISQNPGASQTDEETMKILQDHGWIVIKESGKGITSVSSQNKHIDSNDIDIIADLHTLQTVNVNASDLNDEQLEKLGQLSNLTSLILNETSISDAGLSKALNNNRFRSNMIYSIIAGILTIVFAFLAYNVFRHWFSKLLCLLCFLTTVFFSVQTYFSEIQLQTIYLRNVAITDAGLTALKKLPNLKILDLSETKITNAGMKDLAECKGVEHLLLEKTNIDDSGLKALEGHPQLKRLTPTEMKVTPEGLLKLKKSMSHPLSIDPLSAPPKTEEPAPQETSTEEPAPEQK